MSSISFLILIISQKNFLSSRKPLGGYANLVTTIRLLLILYVLYQWTNLAANQIFILFGINILLDVIDGKLARALNEQSEFGLFYDMETDALFVLTACMYLFLEVNVGWWILIPGLLRYIYKLMITAYSKPDFEESKQKYAAVIAGIYFIILLVSVVWSHPLQYWILIFGSFLIILSFAKSFLDFFRYESTAHQ